MSDAKRRKWLGGYVRTGKGGEMFIIEKWIDGIHFHVSTRCRNERNALKEFERFEADPRGYNPHRKTQGGRAEITAELIADYELFQRNTKKTTRSHARDCANYLAQWLVALHGRDLRNVDLHRDIKPALERWPTARHTRIVALKGFCAWLRREKGLLHRHNDPTLDLQVPPSRPEKLRRKKAIPKEHLERALAHLDDPGCRDLLILLAATGLHVSEARRFAQDGELFAPTAEQQKSGTLAFLAVKHKTGRLHIVALTSAESLEAAQRMRQAGHCASHAYLWFRLRAACDAAGVPRFNAGVLRHSVATWLYEAGADLHAISEQLGHRDPRTTADFYRDMGQTARVLPIPRLRLVR